MELQALLVLCGVGVAGLAMVLLMGLFSTSGTSYEEAIAQQRRATTELLALAEGKNKPKKKEKKANKKQAKKEKIKDGGAAATGSELESEAPAESGMEDDPAPPAKGHVEFKPAVVVDVPRDTPPNVKIRKRGKDPKVKPILLNKKDPSCVSDPSALPDTEMVSNHFEEMHPKDEFELMHSTHVVEKAAENVEEPEKKEKSSKSTKSGKVVAKPAAPVEAVKEVARERHNSGEQPKEQRKGKKSEKKPVSEEVVEQIREEVVPPLNVPQPSELTTDKLLKQLNTTPAPSPPATKSKKKKAEPNVLSLMAGDSGLVNVGELVRVVREASLSRHEIQILTDALLNKHHDPLPEHSEWTEGPNDPMQKLKKQLADKDKALADEIEASQALSAKLKELRGVLNSERSAAVAARRALDGAEARAAAARADLLAGQARLHRLVEDNHQLAQDKLLLQSKLSAEGEAQAQRVQMEMHIQRLSESEAALVAQLGALQAELGALGGDAALAADQLRLQQQHAADLALQLQEANRACVELEEQRQAALLAEQRALHDLRQAQDRLAGSAELLNEIQRLTSQAQKSAANLDKVKEESEKQKQQLSSEIASLRDQLSLRETELAEVKQLRAAPAHNGLPANNEQIKAAELAKVESIVSSLRSELAAAQSGAREHREQVARLQEQLAQYQHKNNEAITKAQEAQYNEVASILRSACPTVAPSTSSGKEWLLAFAKNLSQHIDKAQNSAPAADDVDERLKDLAAQNEHSQSLVEKYKKIIDDTEGVLSRLQQNVTSEEQRWAQQLADKQRELDDLRQRTVQQMQKKIDSLQEELHQVKSSQNHTFADSERLAEERLMGGLSDKSKLDVCNGPLQSELGEK